MSIVTVFSSFYVLIFSFDNADFTKLKENKSNCRKFSNYIL